jgi:hypothetical protein
MKTHFVAFSENYLYGRYHGRPLQIFTISKDQNLTFSLSPSLLRLLEKKLRETKIVPRVNVKKIRAKK